MPKLVRKSHVGKQSPLSLRDFYDKRLREDNTIGSVRLMDEYAKHIIEINFCDGSPNDFDAMTVAQLRKAHESIILCVEWVNSNSIDYIEAKP